MNHPFNHSVAMGLYFTPGPCEMMKWTNLLEMTVSSVQI